ncbi:retrovirus-related pol polyprotein from transposon TNT 1-94, partial [Tanacetum coccineum]
FDISARNPIKEILLKLNLPDHRSILTDSKILKDRGEVKEFQRSFRHSDTERLSRSDEVLKLKNFKKDATLKLSKSTNQEPHGRMILASVEKGPLVWPSITMDGVTRLKEYTELTPAEAIQADSSTYPSPQYGSPYQSQQYSTHQSSTPFSVTYPSNDFQSSIHHNVYSPSSSIPQLEYPPQINQQSEFSQQDSGLIVPVFQKGDDPIDAINHMMSFLTAVVTSRYPTTNNQLRNSSNPRQQATINNGRVTLQPIQGRQTSFAAGTSRTYTPRASGSNSGKQRTVICYNCKGEGHMSRQCTKPKRKRDDSWFKEKVLLVMPSSQQLNVVNHSETEITSDSNIIPYSQYVIESQQATVQKSNSSAQQDDLILSVIEQLKTQVANCTKTNLENKSVNDTLTAELERYKEQVKVLKEGQNVDLRSKDNVSDTCAQSVEIDLLKQTLSEHLKEKESLLQTVTLLKNDFKKEESRNIDREIALEKQIKHLDNIVFKRDQSAQTVHMLTKPQFFYDNTTKQALGFQNPFYLQKAQQSKPKLYVGDIIVQTNPIVIPDSEETLALAEESRSKMLLKHKDNMMLEKEKQVDTTPIDYAALNQLYKDFSTRFVPQTELSAEQAFWSQNSVNSSEPTLSIRPTNVEVPKELPKVSMVNTSLKKLKHHLANFDVVVKERTTPTAITEGSWGFEHTKACFRDEIIPFVQALKDLFSTFNQHLVDELSEVQNVFYQMEQAVEQHRIESKTFEVKMNQVLNENERLLEQVMSKDIVNLLVNPSMENDSVNVHECQKCLKLETELQTNFEIFQSVPSFDQLFELNELKAQSQEKDMVIKKLKERIKSLSGKIDKDKIKQDLEEIETINIELDHRVTKLIAENEHLKQTYKQLYDSIKPARIRSKEQCDGLINQVNIKSAEISDLNASLQEKALAITALKDELRKLKGKALVDNNVSNHPRVKQSTSASGSQPSGNTKKDKIQQTQSRILKNKVEAHPRKVKSSLKNKDCVVAPKGTAHVQHSKLNANYELKLNARKAKYRSVKKNSKRKVWKPTGKVFTNIGYIWRPTGRTFTIVGNVCLLTRITTTTEVPLRKSSALDNKTPKPVVTLVYSRKPRKSTTSVLVNNYKVIKSVTANNSEPSHTWGSIVSNVPSSSLDECRSSKLSSGI